MSPVSKSDRAQTPPRDELKQYLAADDRNPVLATFDKDL